MKQLQCKNGLVVQVDDADYELVKGMSWNAYRFRETWYAVSDDSGSRVYLHRLITGVVDDLEVDHRDGNGLNCCRSNLRVCTHQQNLCNQRKQRGTLSKYKGVSFSKLRATHAKPWIAAIKVKQQRINLGWFATQEEAARAYDNAARKYFGEFARPNFPIIP